MPIKPAKNGRYPPTGVCKRIFIERLFAARSGQERPRAANGGQLCLLRPAGGCVFFEIPQSYSWPANPNLEKGRMRHMSIDYIPSFALQRVYENNVKAVRTKKNLTQRHLAEAVGLSQQRFQRIEAGLPPTSLELAERLAAVLQCSVQDLFPQVSRISSRKRGASKDDEKAALAEAGLDIKGTLHQITLRLKGGHKLAFPISGSEADRLCRNLQVNEHQDFLVFETIREQVAVNYKALICSHFPINPFIEDPEYVDPDHGGESLRVFLIEGGKPLSFCVEWDDRPEDDDKPGQMVQLFNELEQPYGGDTPVTFIDEEGEKVVLFPEHLALCTIPLEHVRQSLLEAMFDGWNEDEEEEQVVS